MRQDTIQRERQIRRLHQSIQKYQQSPNSKKAIEKAHRQLLEAIQFKYSHSTMNKTYRFARQCSDEEQQEKYSSQVEIFNLNKYQEPSSIDLSIAQQPECKPIYISEKTALSKEKYCTLPNDSCQVKSRLKIKICKKKYIETCSSIEKLKRFKTDYTPSNYNTTCLKSTSKSGLNHTISQNSDFGKSKNTEGQKNCNSSSNQGSRCFKKKIKEIYHQKNKKNIDNRHYSPISTHSTLQTQLIPANKSKNINRLGKQNISVILHQTEKDKSVGKQQRSCEILKKNNYGMKFAMISRIQKISVPTDNLKKKTFLHKSFDNLKSIKLGNNSKQKSVKNLKQR